MYALGIMQWYSVFGSRMIPVREGSLRTRSFRPPEALQAVPLPDEQIGGRRPEGFAAL